MRYTRFSRRLPQSLGLALVVSVIALALMVFSQRSEPRVTENTTENIAEIRAFLAPLQIDDTRTRREGYSRDLFPQWLDLDGDGCNARNQTLRDESRIPVTTTQTCTITSGEWYSIYDGKKWDRPVELDIDHVVPLANAWQSGAWRWDASRRAAFANAVDYPDHLIAVTRAVNREKGDKSPNEWRPPSRSSWCRYATAWTTIKVSWGLTATTEERDALGKMLETCAGATLR